MIHSGITDEVVETLGGKFPMMLKTITGSKGKGVMKMESLSSLRGVVDVSQNRQTSTTDGSRVL